MRLAIVGVAVLALFAAMFTRLWYLQVLDSETFVQAASANQVRIIYEEAPRGRILDRHGRVIVDNRLSPAVTVDRERVAKHPGVLDRVAGLLGMSRAEVDERLADQRFSPYKPVPIAQDVPEEVIVYLEEHRADFPGVQAEMLTQRFYPHGSLGAHVLGYVGEINDRELEERRSEGYRLGDSIGKSGIELVYERELRGEVGVVKKEVDSKGRVIQDLGRKEPVQGLDIQTTIDLDIQRVAEESLLRGLERARTRIDRMLKKPHPAPAGSVVVLDPRDGSVVAMASWPSYNPGDFVNGIKSSVFAALQDPANHFPLNNRAVQGQYAPGSTFKLVTAVAAASRGMITANTTITDPGFFRLPSCRGEKCTFRNAGSRAYGRVNLPRSLTVSSDVYYYNLGARFWFERDRWGDGIQETAREFGLGSKTGIPLLTDKAGRVPDPESRRQMHEANPEAFPEGRWYAGDNVNLSIGQGELVVTPLQLANVYATFANGGTLWAPRIASRALDRQGRTHEEFSASKVRDVALPPEIRNPILQGLKGVISGSEGTAVAAFRGFPVDRFPVAGKTGTAQVSRKHDTAVFAAFAPADAPQYSVAVIMEESGFGGSAAAPVARRIFEAIATGEPAADVEIVSATD